MKNILLIILFMAALPAAGQYNIDLRDKQPPALKTLQMGHPGPAGKEIRVNNLYMEIGGVPQLPVMGEFHYSRMDSRYWRDALLKMKASGINIVATYALWSLHEEFEGQFCWTGHLDLRRFTQLCQELGLLVHLRFGPYCNAEIKNGALPDWIVSDKRFSTRSNDPLYLAYVRKWYEDVFNQVGDLLYKDGGPIMALQLENEFVTRGMVVSHLMNLKKMALDVGFDMPLYSMTHWMDSDYPKGEIIPYAGYYIETPWTASGKKELPISGFEYFSYNRISNNIGTDIIKTEGQVESLSGEENESPYFTCEVGIGTTAFYHRRAIVSQEMAGENINLRLGCGVNLMGYYMYTGGSNPVGQKRTYQSSGPRISYDYQAPIREFGTLGDVMYETKKYNYFMNDFGSTLAPAVAYLPVSNQKTENLQWAVRLHENSGYLFCSNHLYKHDRPNYSGVQFNIRLQGEDLRIPRRKVTIPNGAYFLWPFNLSIDDVLLKYSTTQPICKLRENNNTTYFFFQDDGIDAEYLIDAKGVESIRVCHGNCRKEKDRYFINELQPGRECMINITKTNGDNITLVTLTEEESDNLWKLDVDGRDFVALTPSTLVSGGSQVTLISQSSQDNVWIYGNNRFTMRNFRSPEHSLQATVTPQGPMAGATYIRPAEGKTMQREFNLVSYSTIEKAWLRIHSESTIACTIQGQTIKLDDMGTYQRATLTDLVKIGMNPVSITLDRPEKGVIAMMEILLANGERLLWPTNMTWTDDDIRRPVICLNRSIPPVAYAPEEKLGVWQICLPDSPWSEEEIRAVISYAGDVGNAYIGSQFINDSFYDGSDWTISVSRFHEKLRDQPLTIRIDGLKSLDNDIYFEKIVNEVECLQPTIRNVSVTREYRYSF